MNTLKIIFIFSFFIGTFNFANAHIEPFPQTKYIPHYLTGTVGLTLASLIGLGYSYAKGNISGLKASLGAGGCLTAFFINFLYVAWVESWEHKTRLSEILEKGKCTCNKREYLFKPLNPWHKYYSVGYKLNQIQPGSEIYYETTSDSSYFKYCPNTKNAMLLNAIKSKDITLAEKAINLGANINEIELYGISQESDLQLWNFLAVIRRNPLVRAKENNDSAMIELLKKYGAQETTEINLITG